MSLLKRWRDWREARRQAKAARRDRAAGEIPVPTQALQAYPLDAAGIGRAKPAAEDRLFEPNDLLGAMTGWALGRSTSSEEIERRHQEATEAARVESQPISNSGWDESRIETSAGEATWSSTGDWGGGDWGSDTSGGGGGGVGDF